MNLDKEKCDSCTSYWGAEGEEPPCKGCIYAVAGCKSKVKDTENTEE